MEKLMNLIKERRSIRNYLDTEIPDNFIQTILEAVQWAPSWANTQCWEAVVVKDQLIKEQLQQAVPKANPAHKSMAEAPVILALCAKKGISGFYKGIPTTKFGDWFMFDMGLAVQNVCLTAHALGLGAVIIGLFDHDQAKSILHAPDDVELVSLIPLGYPSKTPSSPKRKSINDFIHLNTF